MKTLLLAAGLVLAGCSVAPVVQAPKPTALIVIIDCGNPAFVAAVDSTGHLAIAGGNAKTTDADKALIMAAHDAKDVPQYNLHVGDCQAD